MTKTRQNLAKFLVVLGLLGCSGETGTTAPALTPPVAVSVKPTPIRASAGSAGVSVAPGPMAQAGQMSMGAAEASSQQGVAADTAVVAAAQPSTARFGAIRGKVTTTPPHAAKHAVVYLANAPIEKVVDARIDDVKLDFRPHVSVMTAGGTMTYANSHPFPDSCFSTNNEKFDFGYVEAHGVRKRKFPNAGHYTLLCHVHPNEVGFLIVTPSSYFARADKQGEFLLRDVPVGTYEMVGWAPRVKSETRTVVVTEGELVVEFALKR
jgi:hypothetical protein